MAARGYEFYLRVLKVSLTSERSERVNTKQKALFSVLNNYTFVRRKKYRIRL